MQALTNIHTHSLSRSLSSIRAAVQAQQKCPMCRAPLTLPDVSTVQQDTDQQASVAFDDLTNLHGVKMAALIRYLRQVLSENSTNRCIVFSQWDNMLLRIGETLQSEGVESLYCRGNVHSRNKTLNTFRKGTDEVSLSLCLSLSLYLCLSIDRKIVVQCSFVCNLHMCWATTTTSSTRMRFV
jgi:SNF2 family DNA or RNA helicase